jgi:mannan endo-1,4-beta-mannosidase
MKCRFVVFGVVLALTMTGCGVSAQSASPHPQAKEADCGVGKKCLYVGVAAVRVSALPAFERATGMKPTMVETYMRFGTPLDTGRIATIMGDGAVPLIQLNPFHISLAAIAAGQYDGYLKRFAAGIRQLGQRVVVSFAAEANGTWYSWSCRHTSAMTYVAAWRHIHNVIARYDKNVIWMWDVNVIFPGDCPITARWPGAAYVDWVGVDGYLRKPGATFASVLAPTLTTVRASTGKPVLIAETGVPDVPEAASWLKSIFAGAGSIPGVIGIVYFDYATATGNYRLEHDPPALAVFRRDAKDYQQMKCTSPNACG